MSSPSQSVTALLEAWGHGDDGALGRLIPVVYRELRRVAHRYMARERMGHTLQTTALVNEAYLRLVDLHPFSWQDRVHFFAISARLMRRILVDDARARESLKRGGGAVHVSLDEVSPATREPDVDVLALDEALTKLTAFDSRKARVVELRYFAGLTVEETADALEVSPETVLRDWTIAKLWLLRELTCEARDTSGHTR